MIHSNNLLSLAFVLSLIISSNIIQPITAQRCFQNGDFSAQVARPVGVIDNEITRCTDNPIGWEITIDNPADTAPDSYTRTCQDFSDNPELCSLLGDELGLGRVSAKSACCACGGGVQQGFCCDADPSWKDSSGNGCEVYEKNPALCHHWGDCCLSRGMRPDTNCCVCGGGDYFGPSIGAQSAPSPTSDGVIVTKKKSGVFMMMLSTMVVARVFLSA